ncbi:MULTISPECIES: hypothetical protein [unclassified Microcoleus]|uniref:hypothetical protein n=1 Tax=unclassified Microcoleus TaxID=2642155 RepID=UPI0025F50CCF|nr:MULTISPECIES: hypothetical protein [unclassified Microcoleus]
MSAIAHESNQDERTIYKERSQLPNSSRRQLPSIFVNTARPSKKFELGWVGIIINLDLNSIYSIEFNL